MTPHIVTLVRYLCAMRSHYFKAAIATGDPLIQESLIALLSDEGFEGFEQTDAFLLAYTDDAANLDHLETVSALFDVSFETEKLPVQNWNEVWESNFQPVIIPDFCAVLAPFHEAVSGVPYEIRIMPKMSFGTGHHATTSMMLESLRDLELTGKDVLDFGSGTGLLAILSKMKNAAQVTAIDNDDWAFENCQENVSANQTPITVLQGSLESIAGQKFDVILANINRHILLQYMPDMQAALRPSGLLILSGILNTDEPVILEAAKEAGLRFKYKKEKSNWLCMAFESEAI